MTEDEATELFTSKILPAFKIQYPAMDKEDTTFSVDLGNMNIDGFGSPGMVQLSEGACGQADYVVKFAIAHETAHGVIYMECANQGVNCPHPIDYDAKKHEAWADLIATKVLITQLPEYWALVNANLSALAGLLGGGAVTTTHPTGNKRVQLIREYSSAYVQASVPASKGFLRTIFCCGSKPNNPVLRRQNAFNTVFNKINTSTNF